jgi:CMP-N-acetylneuraminic acid synthetase
MTNLKVVIPVRAGSQRVKNKNFKNFAGKSLLEIKIEQVKSLNVDDIIVNTDSELAIEIAKNQNVSFHRRESYYASSECSGSEYFENLAKVTESKHILIAPVTAPFIMPDAYEMAINTYFNANCNSLMSVKIIKEFLWHNGHAVNYDPSNAPNSQDLPKYLAPTFGLILAERKAMLESKNVICSNPLFHEVSDIEAIDIDTDLDFEFAEFLYNKFYSNA